MAWHRFDSRWWRAFARHWMRFAFRDALSAAFGWGTIPGAAILAAIAGALGLTMSSPTPGQIMILAFAAAGAAGLTAFLINLLAFAPWKAWLAMNPLRLIVTQQTSSPTIVQGAGEKHVVSVIVKNRSPANSVYCTVSISDIKGRDDISLPWQIYSANIPANDEHLVPLAQWFLWEGSPESYNISVLNERSGTFATATMIQLPQSGAELCILARARDYPEIKCWCRVWVEHNGLGLKKIDAPS